MVDTTAGQGDGTGSPGLPGSEWSRIPRWLHRVAHDQAMLAAPGGDQRTLGGLAVVVWVVLDQPGTADELVDRIGELWPGADVGREKVLESLAMLENHDVVRARRPLD